ncbi:MAG: bifunctional 2-keto-4-hydroxyglutarate aldolase/2-keto-3-deoxy-6-phosphogluconate aldolase [Pirellulales bacterium]
MSASVDLQRILDTGVVAVVRADSGDVLIETAAALVAGGVEAIEITFTVPKAHRVIEAVADRLGDRVLVGAGTVLDPETARTALLAGARYIVSPCVNLATIELCKRYGALIMPGAFTPTEILTAWQAGADVVKVFPSEITGPAYLKAIRGPLPQIRLMPTGGVNLQTAAEFLKAGACALGIGGSLVDPKSIKAGRFDEITELAKRYTAIVKETRATMK